jgi:O-antigen/teichoic acid export membrane protein
LIKNKLSSLILNNILSQSVGRSLSFFINFLSITIAARHLGVENFGIFASLLALVTIVSKFIDFGFAQIVFRETSKEKNFEIINNALTLRLLLAIFTIIVFNIIVLLVGFSTTEIILTNALFVNVFISSRFLNVRELFEIRFKVDLRMHKVMITNLIDNIMLLVLVALMPYFGVGLEYFIVVYVISNIPGFILLLYILFKDYGYILKITLSKSSWLIKQALPLFGYVLVLTAYLQFDVLYLKMFDTIYSAGIYSAAVRLTLPLSVIPIAVISTFFPIIVKNISKNIEANIVINSIIYKTLYLLSLMVCVLVIFKSREVVDIVFGVDFIESSSPVIILFIANLFLFQNYFSLDLCTAHNKQYINFIYAVIIFIVNLSILIFTVEQFSFSGAALAKLISLIVGWIFMNLILNKHNIFKIRLSWKIIIWTTILVTSSYLVSSISFILFIVTILLTFFAGNVFFGIYNENEIIIILKFLRKENLLPVYKKLKVF